MASMLKDTGARLSKFVAEEINKATLVDKEDLEEEDGELLALREGDRASLSPLAGETGRTITVCSWEASRCIPGARRWRRC